MICESIWWPLRYADEKHQNFRIPKRYESYLRGEGKKGADGVSLHAYAEKLNLHSDGYMSSQLWSISLLAALNQNAERLPSLIGWMVGCTWLWLLPPPILTLLNVCIITAATLFPSTQLLAEYMNTVWGCVFSKTEISQVTLPETGQFQLQKQEAVKVSVT